jgi:hypothetical protein
LNTTLLRTVITQASLQSLANMIAPTPRPLLRVSRAQDGSEKLQMVDGGVAFDHIRPSHTSLNIVMVFGAARKVSPCWLCVLLYKDCCMLATSL